jgi:hypothetical protein
MKYPASPDHIKVFDNFVEPDDLRVLDRLCRNATENWYGQKVKKDSIIEELNFIRQEIINKYF